MIDAPHILFVITRILLHGWSVWTATDQWNCLVHLSFTGPSRHPTCQKVWKNQAIGWHILGLWTKGLNCLQRIFSWITVCHVNYLHVWILLYVHQLWKCPLQRHTCSSWPCMRKMKVHMRPKWFQAALARMEIQMQPKSHQWSICAMRLPRSCHPRWWENMLHVLTNWSISTKIVLSNGNHISLLSIARFSVILQ